MLFFKKYSRLFITLCLLIAVSYGIGRLYFHLTDGFNPSNITRDVPFDKRWEIRPLSSNEQLFVDQALDQPYHYLGKGCQSYVFESEDQEYVIKFFKYQRFRAKPWLDFFAFIPSIQTYREANLNRKNNKLEKLYASWKIAFEDLQPEAQLVYVHINESDNLQKNLLIFDKVGLEHVIDLDKMQFLVQKKGTMICPTLVQLMKDRNVSGAKKLLARTLDLTLSENARGLADNDHALMQNTGVYQGEPIHLDVGQFVHNEAIKDKDVASQELVNKTHKFRIWLRQEYPELELYLVEQLRERIGEKFDSIKPILIER